MDTAFPNFGKVEYFCGGGLTGFRGRRVFCPDGLNRGMAICKIRRAQQHASSLEEDNVRFRAHNGLKPGMAHVWKKPIVETPRFVVPIPQCT
ncbi:hypothetical protein [Bradyrhizobium sp. CSA207]|uniref:hypothetical protein n=1 Tax=Bradyrhizobium sp. CSA207 TaxID=2698826 RepID=UPI0023B07CB9|nr:hypothetical protein [Bradyrhizobium sp. CSA207]